jgi:L-ascorbate metabolism protein UlaG (beta-lactamase superfamily)
MGQVAEIASRSQAMIISSKTVVTGLQETAPNLQYRILAHAQSFDIGKDITITAYEQLPPLVSNLVNTVFYITSERASILHLGHARDLRGLPDHSPNLLCIPIGGPKYDVCTPQDAAEYTAQIEPEYVLPLMGTIRKSTAFVIAIGAKKSEITTLYPAEGEHYKVPIYRKRLNKK